MLGASHPEPHLLAAVLPSACATSHHHEQLVRRACGGCSAHARSTARHQCSAWQGSPRGVPKIDSGRISSRACPSTSPSVGSILQVCRGTQCLELEALRTAALVDELAESQVPGRQVPSSSDQFLLGALMTLMTLMTLIASGMMTDGLARAEALQSPRDHH